MCLTILILFVLNQDLNFEFVSCCVLNMLKWLCININVFIRTFSQKKKLHSFLSNEPPCFKPDYSPFETMVQNTNALHRGGPRSLICGLSGQSFVLTGALRGFSTSCVRLSHHCGMWETMLTG